MLTGSNVVVVGKVVTNRRASGVHVSLVSELFQPSELYFRLCFGGIDYTSKMELHSRDAAGKNTYMISQNATIVYITRVTGSDKHFILSPLISDTLSVGPKR